MESIKRSNSKDNKKIVLSWEEYILLIHQLIQQIKKSKIKFNLIYGIPRGGLIPASIIAHALNIPYFDGNKKELSAIYYNNLRYKKRKQNILIVDDIVDSGFALKQFTKNNYTVATIYKHKESPIVPNFWVKENDCWIQFPYEKDNKLICKINKCNTCINKFTNPFDQDYCKKKPNELKNPRFECKFYIKDVNYE